MMINLTSDSYFQLILGIIAIVAVVFFVLSLLCFVFRNGKAAFTFFVIAILAIVLEVVIYRIFDPYLPWLDHIKSML